MKEFASWDFLNNFINIVSKNGSIAFFNASHNSERVIIAFLDKLDLKDSTNLSTSGIIAGRLS